MSNSILSELGWDEGLAMPVANAENKFLEDEVANKQREIVQLQNQLAEHDDQVHFMSTHLKNVSQELQHTQDLLNAREKELETEDHLSKIAAREEGRLRQEIKRLAGDMEDLKEKRNVFENSIFKQTSRLEEMKNQMNWDQQALEAWLEESARKDEDAMALQKYTRQDEAKIKELSLRIEHMIEEAQQKRIQLDHETTETLTSQIELDKTAEEFRKAHLDRQDLITQWEQTIDQMQRRDNEMDLLAAKLGQVRGEVRSKEEQVKEKQQFLEQQLDNNKDEEKKIGLAERTAAKIRLEFQEGELQRDQFQSEAGQEITTTCSDKGLLLQLEALKRTVDRTATDLETTRGDVTQLKNETREKQARLQSSKALCLKLTEKLKMATESQLSAEERAQRMDEIMADEEKAQHEIDMELKRLRDTQFKKTQDLQYLKREERNTEAAIQGSRAALRNLNSKINKLDHESLKQQEIIYNQDFAIQQLERRINRMAGEQSNEEKLQLEAKISVLSGQLDETTQRHNLLNGQLRRLQDDVRRVKRDLERGTTEKEDMTSKEEELHLHNDSSERELRRLITNKQDLMVDENILKLQLRRLRDALHSKADEVLSLEHRKLQLETAMSERRKEIEIHSEMLQAQLKAAGNERSQISSELHERISKIDKLRKRYEILMVAMSPGDNEEEKSQAFYVIKAAQEKEELQREGDELDARIKKAEQEILALENTLKLMNNRNETYRKSFNKVTDSSEEMEEKQQLEEQLRAVMDKFKYKRRQIAELSNDLNTMAATMDNLVRDHDAYSGMIADKQNKLMQLSKEMEDQRAKLDRVDKQLTKESVKHRQAAKTKSATAEELDMGIREIRECNKQAMRGVTDMMQQHPDTATTVQLYFNQAELPQPVSPMAPASSISSSRTSSRASSTRLSTASGAGSAGVMRTAKVDLGSVEFGRPDSERSSRSSQRSGGKSQRSEKR